jgi:hypothetical protein
MNINIKKLAPNAVLPNWNNDSAGADLTSLETATINVGRRHLFKTGLSLAIPSGYYGRVAPRSGLALKKGIDVMAGVVDCFSESSKIKTPTGDKSIHELKVDDIVYSTNVAGIVEPDFISAIVSLGEREVIQIETTDGVVELTPGTIVYTSNGTKKASELTIDDELIHF